MKRYLNVAVTAVSAVCIGAVLALSIRPGFYLNTGIVLLGFAVPTVLMLGAMVFGMCTAQSARERTRCRDAWLYRLLAAYVLLLVEILFLHHGSRGEMVQGYNLIPFAFLRQCLTGELPARTAALNLAANLLLLTPLGVFAPVLWEKRKKSFLRFFLLVLVTAVLIELTQFLTFRGAADIDDVLVNVLGAVAAYWLTRVIESKSA